MTFPFESLVGSLHQVGLVVGVLVGFGFGFVLERAGFGRGPKLAAQFYLYDMTVFKVMFGAIVTAMLGVVIFAGLGLVDLASLREGAVSVTYVWPMLIGGLMLGAGFIISGYCPGTSLVSTASGNIDGLVAIAGVLVGTLIFGETFPAVETFFYSGDLGPLFLYQVLGVPPALLAVAVAGVAIAGFFGAEKVEKLMTARLAVAKTIVDEEVRSAPRPRRLAWGVVGAISVVAAVTAFFPVEQVAVAKSRHGAAIDAADLARLIVEEPWSLRILDLRSAEACAAARLPGSECVPAASVAELGLERSVGVRALVVVNETGFEQAPPAAASYPGELRWLNGGFAAWTQYALTAPEPPPVGAGAEALAAYRFRAAMNAALTGRPAAPPPVTALPVAAPAKKKKGGGCSG